MSNENKEITTAVATATTVIGGLGTVATSIVAAPAAITFGAAALLIGGGIGLIYDKVKDNK